MINVITGKPRNGKTTWLAKLVRDEFLKQGLQVFTYYKCRFNDDRVKYFKNIYEINAIKDSIIVLDEGQIWFNSRKWELLDEDLQLALQQHGHHRVDLWVSVQNIKRLDTVMRELVANYYEVKKVAGTEWEIGKPRPKHPWGFYTIHKFEPEDANKKRRVSLKFKWFTAGRKLYDFFDSYVNYDDEYQQEKTKPYTKMMPVKICPMCNSHKLIYSSYR